MYSSLYDTSPGEPYFDLNNPPATVASYGDWEQINSSLVKIGTNLIVAWETYNLDVNKRNIKTVQITPSPTYGFPTIGTATTFSNSGASSYYYTPSISSHSSNDLSLSWRNTTSTILSAKRVSGSWQSVTTLGTGIDPSASERIDNTQNSSIHFRRGTSLPYVLSHSVLATSTDDELEKVSSQTSSFSGEGREVIYSSAKGKSSFVLLNAKTESGIIPFASINEAQSLSTQQEIRTAIQSKPFRASGNVTMELFYKNSGELPPLRKVRVLLEEVNGEGTSIRPLGIVKEYEGNKRENETIALTLPKTSNLVRIIIDPVLRDDSMSVEVSKWYVIDEGAVSFEKQGAGQSSSKVLAPAVLDLLQNYPNPFNPSTTIEFTVPKDGYAKLSVYNSLGQVVATLFDGFAQSGYVQKATFNGLHLASGMYFSRLDFDGKNVMKKMILMK